MNETITLLDTVSGDDIENNGIFSYIRNSIGSENVPEYLSDVVSLNLGYYYIHSGQKTISPLVRHYLSDDGKLSTDNLYKISRILIGAYKNNWDREYEALTIKYSPIENVDASLTETTDRTGSGSHNETETDTGTDTHSKTGTDTVTMTGTDTHSKTGTEKTETTTEESTTKNEHWKDTSKNPGGTSETVNGIAGFNSDEYSSNTKSKVTVNQTVTDEHQTTGEDGENTDTTKGTGSSTVTYDTTDTETLDRTDKTLYNTDDKETLDLQHSRNGSESSTGKEEHTLHRHGNIGVTTNQQMITEELELRKQSFYDILYRDIDKYMTLSIY